MKKLLTCFLIIAISCANIFGNKTSNPTTKEISSKGNNLDYQLQKAFENSSYPLQKAFNEDPIEVFLGEMFELINAGANPNQYLKKQYYYDTTPFAVVIHYAKKEDVLNMTNLLLKKGANPNFFYREHVLQDIKKNISLAKTLIEHGADPYIFGNSKINMLHWAVEFDDYSPELVELYLKHPNANIETQTNNKKARTPLMMLAKGSRFWDVSGKAGLKKLDLLLSYGADQNAIDNLGQTALSIALQEGGHRKLIERLQLITTKEAKKLDSPKNTPAKDIFEGTLGAFLATFYIFKLLIS